MVLTNSVVCTNMPPHVCTYIHGVETKWGSLATELCKDQLHASMYACTYIHLSTYILYICMYVLHTHLHTYECTYVRKEQVPLELRCVCTIPLEKC